MDIMTKVRVLWEKVTGLTADVSAVETQATATAATLAGILPRIPADYSETETATGQKWIDGKDIYCCVKSGVLPEISGTTNVVLDDIFDVDSIISCDVTVISSTIIGYNRYVSYYTKETKKVTLQNAQTAYSNGTYITRILYTKPNPVPAQVDKGTGMITGEDPEPETKKRKTTKKEEK